MNDMNIVDKAKEFAKKAHAGQKRKFSGGDYYEEHLVKVAEYVSDNRHALFPKKDDHHINYLLPKYFETVLAAAYLHDTLEDTKTTKDDLYNIFSSMIRDVVKTLTRRNEETYFDYICRIIHNTEYREVCIAIKIADLRCNMQDLHEGSMKDKYRFAAYILEHNR